LPALGLCIAAPAIFVASHTTLLFAAVACFMIYSFTRIFTDGNMMPVLCLIVDKRYRATGYGILNFFACIVGGIGLYAGGWLRDQKIDLEIIFRTSAFLLIISALILFRIRALRADN